MKPDGPILLILDLDEMLVHATEEPLGHEHDFLVGPYRVYRRPHLADFLTSCSESFRLAIWPSASDVYVREIVGRMIPPGVNLALAWDRSRCVRSYDLDLYEEHPLKDLKKVKRLGDHLDRILIADNTPRRWNDRKLVRSAGLHLRKNPDLVKALYFASSDEKEIENDAQALSDVLAKDSPPKPTWHYEKMPEENHSTIFHPAALKAFRSVFKPAAGRAE